MPDTRWTDVGSIEEPSKMPLQEVSSGKTTIALTYKDGSFAAISGVCNHVGGTLMEGTLDGNYIVCPWYYFAPPRLHTTLRGSGRWCDEDVVDGPLLSRPSQRIGTRQRGAPGHKPATSHAQLFKNSFRLN
ncbi:MAG: Rieske (2Fe-2S) protein [Nitrospiraceae bacterium]|nr:MAG: Rieske (2Fe-2S) protein [Nitrospiraceae bacterium]